MRFLTRASMLGLGAAFLFLSLAATHADAPSLAAADAAFTQNKFDQARKTYASLVKSDPKSIVPYCGLIQSLLRLDQWREALRVAQTAVSVNSSSADARGLLAMTEIRAGEPEEAGTDAKIALAQDKDNYWGLVAAARIANWDGHGKESNTLFLRATTLHPERPDAWLGLVQTGKDNSVTEEDLAVANRYLALKPQGQPFDFTTPFLQNLVTNETGFWRSFSTDTPFHGDKEEGKPQGYAAIFPIQREGNYVLVSVAINGKPFHLLFDSGAGDLLLSKNAAKRLRLPELAKSYVAGMQGRSSASLERAETLTLGSITLNTVPLHVTEGYAGPGDGIFGGAILSDYVVTLDFDNSTMAIARGPGAKHLALPHTSVASMPLHYYDDHLFVSTHVAKRRVWALVDTGAETDFFSLDLTHALSADTPKADWREGSFDARSGIGDSAMTVDYCLTPQKIMLTFDGSSPPATLSQNGLIGQSDLDHQLSPGFDFEVGMMLGIPVLSQHSRVTIDYPNRLLSFEDPLP